VVIDYKANTNYAFLCDSPNINLSVHAATAIPWCCHFSSNRLSCWSHHSHHGITHLYMDSSKCFLQCFHDCTHVMKPGANLNLNSCTIPRCTRYRLQTRLMKANGSTNDSGSFFHKIWGDMKRYNFCFNNICWELWRK